MNIQIKNTKIVEDSILTTVVVNGSTEFKVTAPIEDKTNWGWVGDDNWPVTKANANKACVDADELVKAITEALA